MNTIIIKFQIPGFHRWVDAPEKYHYLRPLHRHIFYFELEIPVTDSNREIEFIDFKDRVMNAINNRYNCVYGADTIDLAEINYPMITHCNFQNMSCEQIAEDVWNMCSQFYSVKCSKVVVLEDNENGGSYGADGNA